ncbi:MAG: hypothetical protein JNM28_04160 [Armatimonadetes bacterium]|nr:hypothetical protein [Armatimonadota bacterium]MBS1710301.1 hypothetical protein [Armatimonadota bacterium]MBX3109062.1 hypothetical protein [Fimbriimonadaceae bacterium]
MPGSTFSFLLVFNIVLAVVLLAAVGVMFRALVDMRRWVKQIGDRIDKLDARLEAQQRQVEELRRQVAEAPDPIQSVIGHLAGWRKNGPLKTVVALGSSLFAAYFKGKRSRVLPRSVESKDQK